MKKALLSALLIIIIISYAFYLGVKKITETITGVQNIAQRQTSNSTPTPTARMQQPFMPTNTPLPQQNSVYKDGIYTGIAADAVYGNIQVRTTIGNGRITNVDFLQYPKDQSTSYAINQYAIPKLAQEAIQAQSAYVDIISSATLSSNAFIQSLQSTLTQAKR